MSDFFCIFAALTTRKNDMPNNIGFLFDLDGVLIDSERKYTEIWNTINRIYPTGIDDLAERIKGTTLDSILDNYFPDPELKPLVESKLLELEGKMEYDYTPGAHDLLLGLRERDIPSALVTSSNNIKMEHLRKDLPEIMTLLDQFVVADMVTHSKPDPEGYLLGASLIKRDPRACVVFEDSLQGVKAGRAAGSYVVGVTGTFPVELLREYSNLTVDSLEEIDIDRLSEELSRR